MKKLFTLILTLILIISFSGCNKQKNSMEIADFSYSKEILQYTERTPGVKYEGFVNTSELTAFTEKDVIDRAKNECTVEYNSIQTYFDNVSKIWKVLFFSEGTLGGCQSVYLNENGKTILIVYGE